MEHCVYSKRTASRHSQGPMGTCAVQSNVYESLVRTNHHSTDSYAGVGDVHFVAIPSSVKTIPATVKADDVVEPSRHEVFNRHTYSRGSFAVRAGERSTHVIEGLASGEPYDVYFILEVMYVVLMP